MVWLWEKGDGWHGTHHTPAVAMSPATSAQVRRRQAARRRAVERQRQLNEERRQRDELELELAADFALSHEEYLAAKDAVHAAEVAMGRLVDRMIGELRLRYPRAAQLLEIPEDELRRLRQVAAAPDQRTGTPNREVRTSDTRSGDEDRRSRADPVKSGPGRSRRAPPTPTTTADLPAASASSPD
jgi:hypothetical protein